MSWLFSQALVEEFSPATFSDGEPSAQLNVMPTPHKFWRSDKTIEPSDLSRFGLTCRLLTDGHGAAVLTSFLAAFPARTSASPAKAPASTVPGQECGPTWRGWLARYDPDSSSWKTAQRSFIEDSDECLATLPTSGMTRGGLLWELPMLELPTSATASGSWPTPTVSGNYNRKGASAKSGDGLATAVLRCATPTARDWRSGKASEATMMRNSRPLSEQIGGSLNPTWVEWLMGWPLGWTDLEPSATDRYRSALRPPSACLPPDAPPPHTDEKDNER
jgi:hypothetical protein